MSSPRHIRIILPSRPGPGTVDWNEIMLRLHATYGEDVIIDDIGWEIVDLTDDLREDLTANIAENIADDLFSTDDEETETDQEHEENDDENENDDEDDDDIEFIHYIEPDHEDLQ
jgi:hypothetical protein